MLGYRSKNKIITSLYAVVIFLLSGLTKFAFAESAGAAVARDFVAKINSVILYPLIILLMGIAFLVFLYGAFEYVAGADNETARETGRRHLIWGVIGFLVMVSAMTILEIAANTFNVRNELDQATVKLQ